MSHEFHSSCDFAAREVCRLQKAHQQVACDVVSLLFVRVRTIAVGYLYEAPSFC